MPNGELAAAAGLAVANGIVVNDELLTADPDISAIGDCASFPCAHAEGAATRLEAVQNAADHARCVADRIVGKPHPYDALPWFWSEQGELRLQIAGLCTGYDRTVLRGDAESGEFSVFCYKGGHLLGVESINRPADHAHARRLLADRPAGEPGTGRRPRLRPARRRHRPLLGNGRGHRSTVAPWIIAATPTTSCATS